MDCNEKGNLADLCSRPVAACSVLPVEKGPSNALPYRCNTNHLTIISIGKAIGVSIISVTFHRAVLLSSWVERSIAPSNRPCQRGKGPVSVLFLYFLDPKSRRPSLQKPSAERSKPISILKFLPQTPPSPCGREAHDPPPASGSRWCFHSPPLRTCQYGSRAYRCSGGGCSGGRPSA